MMLLERNMKREKMKKDIKEELMLLRQRDRTRKVRKLEEIISTLSNLVLLTHSRKLMLNYKSKRILTRCRVRAREKKTNENDYDGCFYTSLISKKQNLYT